jgi:uncharacterized protein (TIGR00251 family)
VSWHRIDGKTGALILTIQAQPNAKRSEVVGLHGDALKIRLAAPALDGRANECLVGFLANSLGVKLAQVNLVSGDKSRRKVVSVTGTVNLGDLYQAGG